MSCALYLDIDIPHVIRYLGGLYTVDDRNLSQILQNITGIVPDETVRQIKHILTIAAPTEFKGDMSLENFLD